MGRPKDREKQDYNIESDMSDTQDVLMEQLKKLGLSSEFGLFMKSEISRMSECLHGIHKSLNVSPHNKTTIYIHTGMHIP